MEVGFDNKIVKGIIEDKAFERSIAKDVELNGGF